MTKGWRTNETNAVNWLSTLKVKPSTQKTYASHLQAAFRKLPPLQQYMKGLNRIVAMTPIEQAPPATRTDIDQAILRLPNPRDQAAMWLSWKTVSRWDEINLLKGFQFLQVMPREIILHWGSFTKTSALKSISPWLYVVITPNPQEIQDGTFERMAAIIKTVKKNDYLTQLTTQQISSLLARVRIGLSARSIKRGAVTYLLQHQIPLPILSRIAKHATKEDFSASTLRYAADVPSLARALETQKATSLL
jgi:hypothetical protein